MKGWKELGGWIFDCVRWLRLERVRRLDVVGYNIAGSGCFLNGAGL